MEENIKILEDFIKYCEAKVISKKNNRAFGICIYKDDIQALEDLLKGYRKLEEELKREKIWRIRLEKENEDTCNEVNNNYIRKSLVIPKSKIKEKIEELEKEKDDTYTKFLGSNRNNESLSTKGKMLEGGIQALQKLMEE